MKSDSVRRRCFSKYGLDEENHGEACGGDAAGAVGRARREGTSVSALIRGLVERGLGGRMVYGITADLAGSLAGSPKAATNVRGRFWRECGFWRGLNKGL
jgi:hypothetical protein